MGYLVALCTLFCIQAANAKTLVIADIDDTLRLTNRKASIWEQLQNVADPNMGFYGLPEIFDAFAAQNAQVYYVSGTVAPISDFSMDFLIAFDFPQRDHFIYRGWFEGTKEFKIRVIEELIVQEKPDKIILLGDNGEQDVDAYEEIVKAHHEAISYVHKLYGPDGTVIPNTQSTFLTGADLALQLYLSGDISFDEAAIAIKSVSEALTQTDPYYLDLVFPRFADISTNDVERAFGEKNQWPGDPMELNDLEHFVSRDARISLRYFHLCQ